MKRFRHVALALQDFLSRREILAKIESRFFISGAQCRPVFIIGAPRTGTTLVYQLLLNAFCFSYITNAASLFIKAPVLITRLTEVFRRRATIPLNSTYGYVPGLFSPSEAGRLMRYWFDESPPCVAPTITSLATVMGGPLLCKNLNNSLRMKNIVNIVPDSLFTWVKRKPVYAAQSILLARRSLFGGEEEGWFSVKPEGYEQVTRRSAIEQVVWQVKRIDDRIERSIEDLGLAEKVLQVDYEDVCDNPTMLVDSVERFLTEQRVAPDKRRTDGGGSIGLRESKKKILTDNEWDELVRTIEKTYRE